MSTQVRCNVCLGVYTQTLPDGYAYYHQCPPLGENPDGTFIQRPGARNENVMVDALTGQIVMIANGIGFTILGQ